MREVSYSFLRETLDPGEWDGDNNARGDDRRVNVTAEPIERHFNPAVRRFHLSPGEEMWDCCDSEDTSLLWGISIFTPFITPSCSQISILRDSHSQHSRRTTIASLSPELTRYCRASRDLNLGRISEKSINRENEMLWWHSRRNLYTAHSNLWRWIISTNCRKANLNNPVNRRWPYGKS